MHIGQAAGADTEAAAQGGGSRLSGRHEERQRHQPEGPAKSSGSVVPRNEVALVASVVVPVAELEPGASPLSPRLGAE